ncbi:MAG: 16S rRNA (uracil(1498)-N(3))-methyltransferase [Clostridia bacterium]|nr:16S rRNA (uracil(1498)-N(3))-methyltransferase [Clostridia bacterium]
MRRFYCKSENINQDGIFFDKDESQHIKKVLRLTPGEEIIVSDGTGEDYLCVLTECAEKCVAKINGKVKNENEPKTNVILFQAVIKNEKMDLVIQKAAELGITKIVPVITARTVVKIEDAKKELHKKERWQKIALEACKQCGRSKVPEVCSAMSLKEAIKLYSACETKIVAYEEEKTQSITKAVTKTQSVGYFIGPEGGITEEEHSLLVSAGGVSVSLGKRILRAETAAIACGAVIMALTGEMNV